MEVRVGQRGSKAYVSAEVGRAVRTVADNPEDCGGALLFTLELAAFLSWHNWRDEGRGRGGGGGLVGGERFVGGGRQASGFIFI